jgi:hypothetical protein
LFYCKSFSIKKYTYIFKYSIDYKRKHGFGKREFLNDFGKYSLLNLIKIALKIKIEKKKTHLRNNLHLHDHLTKS